MTDTITALIEHHAGHSATTRTALPQADPTACPSWCTCTTLTQHKVPDWYWTGDSLVRDHDGPSFGEHVDVNGQQKYDDGRCSFAIAVEVPGALTADQARELASSLVQAAEWIEAQA